MNSRVGGSVVAFNSWHSGFNPESSDHIYDRLIDIRKDVVVIYTGGTLGMQKNEDGALAPTAGFFTKAIMALDELIQAEMPSFDVVEYSNLLDSSCFSPKDWTSIALDIKKAYPFYKGFVICMGTDTMAYASSALSFMIEDLDKPIVFTGSLIPFFEAYNDARRNVIVSILIASSSSAPKEVTLFFSNVLLRGNRASKIHADILNAFDSPNFPPLATLDGKINFRSDLYLHQSRRGNPTFHTEMNNCIIVVKLIPGFDDDALINAVSHSETLKAIVLLAYGTGNSPNRRVGFLKFVEAAKSRGVIIVVLTQCAKGTVNLGAYEVGMKLEKMGVICGKDMTTEAAVTKLAHLISLYGNDLTVIRKYMSISLRGEMTEIDAPREKL